MNGIDPLGCLDSLGEPIRSSNTGRDSTSVDVGQPPFHALAAVQREVQPVCGGGVGVFVLSAGQMLPAPAGTPLAEVQRDQAERPRLCGAGLLSVGVGRFGVRDFNFSLVVDFG